MEIKVHHGRDLKQENAPSYRVVARMLLLSTALLAVGCGGGPDLVSIEGKVTLEGEPLSNALVRFLAINGGGRGAAARTDEQGQYDLHYNDKLDGITPGQYQVQITTRDPESIPGPDNIERVPERYNLKTELKVQVDGSESNLDFELDS